MLFSGGWWSFKGSDMGYYGILRSVGYKSLIVNMLSVLLLCGVVWCAMLKFISINAGTYMINDIY